MQNNDKDNTSNPLKAIEIMEGLAHFPSGATLSDICQVTELNKSSVYRILNALVDRNYVLRNEISKTYRLTYKILSISSAILDTIEIKKLARNQLMNLADLSSETVHLLSKDGYEGLYIDKIDTPNTIGLKSQIGKHIPLYCTSGGKVLLAYSDISYKLKFFEHVKLERFTNTTIIDPDQLMQELNIIKKQGYAFDNAEHHDNIICVSVPIFTKQGTVEASISIAAPSYRFSLELARSYIPAMQKNAELITQSMPY